MLENDELDAQLHVCKKRRLDELSKRVMVRVMAWLISKVGRFCGFLTFF